MYNLIFFRLGTGDQQPGRDCLDRHYEISYCDHCVCLQVGKLFTDVKNLSQDAKKKGKKKSPEHTRPR